MKIAQKNYLEKTKGVISLYQLENEKERTCGKKIGEIRFAKIRLLPKIT
jgi:hypothetical protein